MPTYLALLRGVNVGAANRIRMDELRRLFEQAGYSRVETVIQSGNVLFEAQEEEAQIARMTEAALFHGAGIQTTVILRSAEEFLQAVSHLPFSAEKIASASANNLDGESLYLLFAAQPPAPEKLAALNNLSAQEGRFHLLGRDAYLLLTQSIRTSKLAIRLQNALSPVTARNWNTVLLLRERICAR